MRRCLSQIDREKVSEGGGVSLVDVVNQRQRNADSHAVQIFITVIDQKFTPTVSVQKESTFIRLALIAIRHGKAGAHLLIRFSNHALILPCRILYTLLPKVHFGTQVARF